jgi:hypothetical protein
MFGKYWTNFVMLFHAKMEFCQDLLRSKFWLIGEWSIIAGVVDQPWVVILTDLKNMADCHE